MSKAKSVDDAVKGVVDFDALPPSAIVRRGTVRTLVPVSAATLHRMILDGQFPKPIQIGPRANGWRVADVREFLQKGGQPS